MDEDSECATTREVNQFEERVKKHLTRPTVQPELLERYLQQIQGHQEFRKLDIYVPYPFIDEGFPDEFIDGMRQISTMLDEPSEEENGYAD